MMVAARQPATVTRVLVVEDNPGDAELVRLALEEETEAGRFEVDHATRLVDALARLEGSAPPAVVLLDLSLPDAFGLDGLRRLNDAAPDIPVVVLTGSSSRDLGRDAIQAGAQDYLSKGVDATLVPRALRYAIERHEHAVHARLLAQERAARAEAEAARERMAVLAAASTAVAHSLEDRHALTSLGAALVPRLVDWCATRVAGAEQGSPEWLVAHGDTGAAAAVSACLDAAMLAPAAASGPAAVLASGRSELYQDVPGNAARSPWRAALEGLGVRSAMVVPVRLVDEVFGVMVLAASRRRFGPDDLLLAEEIGRRAGVATANCRLYREARLAAVARDEFVSIAAHELRTPVTVLQLKLQQVELKQQASVCATCEHAVPADYRGAARQILRLGHVIEELLDVSRLVGGGVTLERDELDLGEVARQAIERLVELATRSRSPVVLECAGPVRGAWDRLAVERILANLVSNALKFGAEKPVEVRIGSQGEQAVIEVEDHGIGIAPEDLGRVFGPFERAVSSRHFGGLGLGLYITRRLVEEHGGTISAASRPGYGSVFTVRLPMAPHRAA